MKEIKAFIRPNMIDYVIDAIEAPESPGITLSDVRGWGYVKDDDQRTPYQAHKTGNCSS